MRQEPVWGGFLQANHVQERLAIRAQNVFEQAPLQDLRIQFSTLPQGLLAYERDVLDRIEDEQQSDLQARDAQANRQGLLLR